MPGEQYGMDVEEIRTPLGWTGAKVLLEEVLVGGQPLCRGVDQGSRRLQESPRGTHAGYREGDRGGRQEDKGAKRKSLTTR